jgi:hypothetical protein
MSRVTVAALVALLVSTGCRETSSPGRQVSASPVPSVAPECRIRLDFTVTVDPGLAKAYGKVLALPPGDLEPAYVADGLADGFDDVIGLWSLSRARDAVSPCGQVEARIKLEPAHILEFNLAGNKVEGVSSELEMWYHNAKGAQSWKAAFGTVSLTMPLYSDRREQWRGILRQTGLDIFSRARQQGFIQALQASRVPLVPRPAISRLLNDPSVSRMDETLREAFEVATILRDAALLPEALAYLRKCDLSQGVYTLYFSLAEYVGAIDDPAARKGLLDLLAAYPPNQVESGYIRENFLITLTEELARQAPRDAAIEPALRRKLEETTVPRYREIVTKALGTIGKAKDTTGTQAQPKKG